jgi:hypothetical protein
MTANPKAAKKHVGRPPAYKSAFAAQAAKLCSLGATDIEIADFFEKDVRTIYRWKHDHPEFCQALNAGKDKADDRVVHSLYQRAVGYEQEAVKIFMPAGAKNPVYAPYREKIAPDTTAAIFWLKNRRRDDWRDRQDHEHSGQLAVFLSPTDGEL